MIDAPGIVQTAEQLVAAVRLTVPRAEIREAMGPGYRELMTTLAGQGLAPAGPWLTHHLRMDPDVFDFEICVPVTTPVLPTGRVTPGRHESRRIVRTVYHGGYEGLPGAWAEFMAWITGNGHRTMDDLWERYLVGPEAGDDPVAWQTELSRTLASSP